MASTELLKIMDEQGFEKKKKKVWKNQNQSFIATSESLDV